MTALEWGAVGQRFFETGTDRGVLYPKTGEGVSWNGLLSVSEEPSGGEAKPYYFDGFKYLNLATAEEFVATIEAFSAPPEFGVCDGTAAIHNGLFITQQRRESFGFSYRTKIGNDLDGADHGYKLHLVYNALSSPSQRSNTSIGDSLEPMTLSWGITTAPPPISGFRPSAHFIIDSLKTEEEVLVQIEDMLYGTSESAPRLPNIDEIISLY